MSKCIRSHAGLAGLCALMLVCILIAPTPSHASCGAVTCFVVIGSQQQVAEAGLLTVNAIYNYTPMRLLSGTNGVIPGVDQATRDDPGSSSGDSDHYSDGDARS